MLEQVNPDDSQRGTEVQAKGRGHWSRASDRDVALPIFNRDSPCGVSNPLAELQLWAESIYLRRMECRVIIPALCLSLVCLAAHSCDGSFPTSDAEIKECCGVCRQQLPTRAGGPPCINSSKALYSTLVVILRDELEWRSFRDMFYVTLLTPTNETSDSCKEKNCTRVVSTVVFAKSVAFFLVRADILKSIITPWLSTLGLFLPNTVEQINVTIPSLECGNNVSHMMCVCVYVCVRETFTS